MTATFITHVIIIIVSVEDRVLNSSGSKCHVLFVYVFNGPSWREAQQPSIFLKALLSLLPSLLSKGSRLICSCFQGCFYGLGDGLVEFLVGYKEELS